MKVQIEKAGRAKVRLTFTDEKGGESCVELTPQNIQSLLTLCEAAMKSERFSMSVEVTGTVSRR